MGLSSKKRTLKRKEFQVPPRFELGSLDSESRVLTITPWNLIGDVAGTMGLIITFISYCSLSGVNFSLLSMIVNLLTKV